MSTELAKHLKGLLKKEASKFVHKYGGQCRHCKTVLKKEAGAWGLCARHYKRARRKLLKEALIAYKGGLCTRCSRAYHMASFDFHHPGKKTDNPSELISEMCIEHVAEELDGCELICSNCHREHHYRENNNF